MGHKKLIRFEAIKGFPNVLQYPTGMPGQWQQYFTNHHPITLELACGKGEYTVQLAAMYPQRNFIGVDLKGNRLYVGAKKCLAAGLSNAAFLRTQIDKITDYFLPGEVEEIWITFPDPQLRTSKAKKRLTHPAFLRRYQQILRSNGVIHLKTDSPDLYHFTKRVIDMYGLELITDYDNLYALPEVPAELRIKTHYEGLDIAQSSRIHYLQFRLPAMPLPVIDAQLQELLKTSEVAIERRD
ncbi:MAG TPA: tRNA (guanosine(46)-N7)-methyltransferase TrmB [Chitinophagaceae bacterium]|nr:tRNA (guanosine(46)-N7)-methyltransferase TrmB [Chitinophagaceae bacterium]